MKPLVRYFDYKDERIQLLEAENKDLLKREEEANTELTTLRARVEKLEEENAQLMSGEYHEKIRLV